MSSNIIDNLTRKSERNISRKILKSAKYLGYFLTIGFSALVINGYTSPNRDVEILENLLERDSPIAQTIAFKKLQSNPKLINELSENYSILTSLDKIVFGDESKSVDKALVKLTRESPNRVTLSSDEKTKYFSGQELGENLKFFSQLNLVYDPKNSCAYELNRNNQRLEKILGGVTSMEENNGFIYFSQENDLFKFSEGNKIRLLQENKDDKKRKIYPVYGSNSIIFIGENENSVFSTDEIESLSISNLSKSLPEMSLDNYTKFIYRNNVLYASNEDLIVRVGEKDNKITVLKFGSPFAKDFDDYVVQDIDGDGKDEIAFFDDVIKTGYYVYGQDNEGDYEKLYSISGGNSGGYIHFNHNTNRYDWLNPEKLKSDALYHLQSLKREN
ncbi:MAG: hypothetical protein OQK82_02650 [Candidatus Pacearchaeota archaeon]|nr:hypothetical protein [Candidatus Pacearchaeota archaeon]